jgi:drug/metabolite transporter (DMT)-like permease
MTRLNGRELVAFFAIYVIWGSTYLAIRHAVETIPPLLTAGVRHLVGGLVLFVIYVWARRVHVTIAEWRASFVVAVLFFLIGHGTLHWAEQTVPSGIAALLVATEPVWIAMLMPAEPGSRWRWRSVGGLLAGLGGVALLVPLESLSVGSGQLWGSSAILAGAMSWALGVRYAATATLPRDAFVRAATTLLCGAGLLLTASVVAGEIGRVDVRAISGRSLLGLGYLIVFGSVVAFSAYTWLLERRPATLVATHTFVNPAVAVVLGWLLAGETLTPQVVGATVFILAAVVLLESDSSRHVAANGPASDAEPARAPDAARTHTDLVIGRGISRTGAWNGEGTATGGGARAPRGLQAERPGE